MESTGQYWHSLGLALRRLCAIVRSYAWEARFGRMQHRTNKAVTVGIKGGWHRARRFLARAKPPQSPPRKRTRPDDNDAHDALTIYTSIVDNQGMGKPTDLVQGTLDLLILRTLANEPKHGWAIAKRIQQISKEVLQVQQGSLYPALHRLEQRGWITAKWAESETGRQAKFYRLTSDGRKQLERETANWKRLSQAINLVVSEA